MADVDWALAPGDLRRIIDARRAGAPFLAYADEDGALSIHPLAAEESPITIGRAAAATVSLSWDGQVSRSHALLVAIGEEWVLEDDGLSRNGTFVAGRRLAAHRRLEDGDVVQVGRTQLLFRRPGADAASSTELVGERPAPDLTPTQRRILSALCRPYLLNSLGPPATNVAIATELTITVDAVKSHLTVLFRKFGVGGSHNEKRVRLAERALTAGLVDLRLAAGIEG